MATRYWRGGAGTWNATNTANWSATSGGAGGASAPTSADDVVFNSASNAAAYTVTITANSALCKSLTAAGPAAGNVTLSGSPQVFGDLTLAATGVAASALSCTYLSSSAQTITSNGITTGNATFGRISPLANGSYTLGSAFVGGTVTLVAGSLNTAGFAFTASGTLSSTASATSFALTLGASTVSVGILGITNPLLTLSAGTSTVNITSATGTFNNAATAPALTFYNVSFTGATRSAGLSFYKANTFNNLTFATLSATDAYPVLKLYANQTVNGTLTLATNAVSKRYSVQSDISGVSRTLSAGAVSLTNVDFRDITAVGTATWSGTSIGNLLGNIGITFTAAKTSYFSSVGGSYSWFDNQWASTSGGSPAVGNYPLPQDTAVFDNNSGTLVIGIGLGLDFARDYTVSTLNTSGLTSASLTLGIDANIAVLQNATLGPNNSTMDYLGRITFSGRSAQTASFSTYGLSSVRVSGVGTTVSLASSPSSPTGGVFVTQGTLALNGYNWTTPAFTDSGSTLTRAVNFGSNKVYTADVTFAYPTNLTFSGTGGVECDTTAWGGSAIFINAPQFDGSTSAALSVAVTGVGGTSDWQVVGGGLFKNFTISTDTVSSYLPWGGGGIHVTGNLTLPGYGYEYGLVYLRGSGTVVCSNSLVDLYVLTTGTYTTSGTTSFNSLVVQNGTFSLGANAAINSTTLGNGTLNLNTRTLQGYYFDNSSTAARTLSFGAGAKIELSLGSNPSLYQEATNLSITGTYYVALSSASQAYVYLLNYSDSPLAPTITDSGTSGIVIVGTTPVRIEAGSSLGHVSLPSYAGALTLANTNDDGILFWGNVTIGASATVYSLANSITFATNSSRALNYSATSYTGSMDFLFAGTGTWTLQAALALPGSIKLFTGTLASNGYSVSAYSLQASGTYFGSWTYGINTLTLGASTWTITGNLWQVDATNTTVNAGTSTISMSAGNFYGGGKAYNIFRFASFGDVVSVFDSNTFTTLSNTIAPGITAGGIGFEGVTTVTNFNLAGAVDNPLVVSGGTLSKVSGTVNASYLDLYNSIAAGGATWNAFISNGNINDGGNVGWHFSATEPGKFFLLFS